MRRDHEVKTMCIYGDSGTTKTTQLYFIAKYLLDRNPGKKIRVIVADGGGSAPLIDSGLVRTGKVDYYNIAGSPTALADTRRLSLGYWPRGENKEHFATDQQCLTTPEEWENIIAYLVDGLTGVCSLWLTHMQNRPEKVGFKHSVEYTEDEFFFGGLQEGHYGLAQREAHNLITHNFSRLPIDYFITTALVGSGMDRRKQEKVFGPQLCGQAATPEVPSWFRDVIHTDVVVTPTMVDGQQVQAEQMVAWFLRHYENGIPHLCKPRIMPEGMPLLMKAFPKGYVKLNFERGLDKYIEVLDRIREKLGT